MPREVKSKKSKSSGLGKGLGNLMKVDTVESVLPEKEIHELPISELVPNAEQPRKSFDEDSLATLAESIKNLGIFQPIVVRKQKNKYQIVAGERRYRAAIIAGLENVPVIVKKYKKLYNKYIKILMDTYKQTQEMISARLGRSRSYIANMVRLLKLCDSVQKDLIEGDLTVGQARPLLALRSAAQQIEAAERIKEGELSARQAEALVKSMQNKTPKTKAAKPQSTAEVRALMDRLKLSLGSPVNIKFRAGKKVQGKIEIAFSSEAELERLIAFMDGQDNTDDTETVEFRV